jgi:hypothetical protein
VAAEQPTWAHAQASEPPSVDAHASLQYWLPWREMKTSL